MSCRRQAARHNRHVCPWAVLINYPTARVLGQREPLWGCSLHGAMRWSERLGYSAPVMLDTARVGRSGDPMARRVEEQEKGGRRQRRRIKRANQRGGNGDPTRRRAVCVWHLMRSLYCTGSMRSALLGGAVMIRFPQSAGPQRVSVRQLSPRSFAREATLPTMRSLSPPCALGSECLASCSGGFLSPTSRLDAGGFLGHGRCCANDW